MMMCNRFLAAAAMTTLGVSRALAADPPYVVEVATEPGLVEPVVKILFETVAAYPSMCGRKTVRVEIQAPSRGAISQAGDATSKALGRVGFDTELRRGTICLMAFGPHRGGLELAIGGPLPALSDGDYELVIDGVAYGLIRVEDQHATLID